MSKDRSPLYGRLGQQGRAHSPNRGRAGWNGAASESGSENDTMTPASRSSAMTHVGESASALYYITKGFCLFSVRPRLWVKVIMPIFVTLASTAVSLIFLYTATLKLQKDLFLKISFPEWLAWITAVLLVLVETGLINLIIMLVLFGCVQSQIFRDILEERGVLAEIRKMSGGELFEQYCWRDVSHSIGFLLLRLPLLILTLPLNGVPVAGQVAWVFLNGWLYTWELTAEFMVMLDRRLRCANQLEFVKEHCGAYVNFGAGAMALELIPFVGPWVFFATNACGAALLAERIFLDRKRNGVPLVQSPAGSAA